MNHLNLDRILEFYNYHYMVICTGIYIYIFKKTNKLSFKP